VIAIRDLSVRFGPVVALDRVTLSISPGERIAFVGANGSGKTTLLRSILGLVRFRGSLTIGGKDVAREPETALREVAYIPQIAPPIEAPVAEVVRAHAGLRGLGEDETWRRARALGLDPDESRRKRFRDLSGGMKQKLLAAMALATEAPVLVCDEPTANLDGDARAAFLAAIEARPDDAILVVCSHRPEEVGPLVGRVVEMEGGSVKRDAPAHEVLHLPLARRLEVVA
jgi:ABC-type multidrug transport system ATPase subunit